MPRKMDGVREYNEEFPVEIAEEWRGLMEGYRPVIVALNENQNNSTKVDLLDVISWVKREMPELLA